MHASKVEKREKRTTEEPPSVNIGSRPDASYYYDDATGYEVFREIDEECEDRDGGDDESDAGSPVSE